MKRIIYTSGPYRITEVPDDHTRIDDLLGDYYCPVANPDLDAKQLEIDKKKMINRINEEGVFGYVLEKWNPDIDMGWEHIDSCWGFVGQYQENALDYDHYIVNELKSQIKKVG
jgi:hypothetical protein